MTPNAPPRRRRKPSISNAAISKTLERVSPIKFLRRRGRQTPFSFFWWLLMLSLAAVLKVVWHSMAFTRYLMIDGDQYNAVNLSTQRHSTSSSRILRPPMTFDRDEEETSHSTMTQETATRLQVQIPPSPAAASDLCGTRVNADSRVLIVGLLSHSFGSELAIFLSQECKVKRIAGLSEHAMDSEGYNRLAFLRRNLPDLEIYRTEAVESGPDSLDISRIFESLIPTHVIHLEPTAFLPPSLQIHPPMAAVRNSIQKIERLCEAMVKQKVLGNPSSRLVFVTTSPVGEDAYLESAINDIYPLLLKTFRSLYEIQLTHLQLPTIYGPFPEVSYIMDTILNPTKKLASSFHPAPKIPASMVHISDSIYLVLNCMARIKTLPPSFIAAKAHTLTLQTLSSALRADTVKNDRLSELTDQILSWYHKSNHLYDTTVDSNPRLQQAIRETNNAASLRSGFNQSLLGISQLERRNFQLLSCASECTSAKTICRESAFDGSILSVSQNVTNDCRYVVYTSDFSTNLEYLPLMRNRTEQNLPWPSHLVCQLAFVSPNSMLVSKLIQEHEVPEEMEISYWNGKLNYNQWNLVWPNQSENDGDLGTDVPLQEADYMMPKIAPGKFFSQNVTTSLYIELKQVDPLPSIPILWYLMAKQMHQKGIPSHDKVQRRRGRIHFPGIPPRHVALLSHWSRGQHFASAGAMAKFVLEQKGTGWERRWPHQQMQAYDFAWQDYDFALPDTYLLIHNLQSERSRRLRCQWYEEQLFWSDDAFRNRDLEDMTLAFVLARLRMESRLVPFDETWGERLIQSDEAEGRLDPNSLPSQYFVKLLRPLKVRRYY
eukprot:scaffold2214_cov139-Cylindrotheca_fusiformis.AAC.20